MRLTAWQNRQRWGQPRMISRLTRSCTTSAMGTSGRFGDQASSSEATSAFFTPGPVHEAIRPSAPHVQACREGT